MTEHNRIYFGVAWTDPSIKLHFTDKNNRISGNMCTRRQSPNSTILDMPQILLKEWGAFGNAETDGAWQS
ncbi:hypothetical protein YC2023_079689 [Brassica napus]